MRDYLALPFSYLALAMKAKIEADEGYMVEENAAQFDMQAFNYMINKSTQFIDSAFVSNDHINLKSMLYLMEKKDPASLGILNYIKKPRESLRQDEIEELNDELEALMNNGKAWCSNACSCCTSACCCCAAPEEAEKEGEEETQHEEIYALTKMSALHSALQRHNTYCVEILLEYMSRLNTDASGNFKDIYQKLIEFNGFKKFADSALTQTTQMSLKSVFKVLKNSKKTFLHWIFYREVRMDEDVIQVQPSRTQLIDNTFFADNMEEASPNNNSKGYEVCY